MINISNNRALDIITPNTNKALAAVLKHSSAKELQSIIKGKDLSSVLGTLLKGTEQNFSADKALLELLNNNQTLKELKDVSSTLKDLLSNLKQEKSQTLTLTSLKEFLVDIKDLKEPLLKQKLQNSGVFLESKLKEAPNPRFELKDTLVLLDKTLQNSPSSLSKSIRAEIKELLTHPAFKETPKEAVTAVQNEKTPVLDDLPKKTGELALKLQSRLKGEAILDVKAIEVQAVKLEKFLEPRGAGAGEFKSQAFEEVLQKMSTQFSQSQLPQAKSIMDAIVKILDLFNAIKPEMQAQPENVELFSKTQVLQESKELLGSVKRVLKEADPLFSKQTSEAASKLLEFASPQKLSAHESIKEMLSSDLKAVLLKAKEELSGVPSQSGSQLMGNVEKLLLQIDYYQLLSHLSNSSCIYLPFVWEEMQEGNVSIKRDKEDRFYCDIELKLKEYGEVKLRLALYDKNSINIHVYSDSDPFRDTVKENMASLKSALRDSDIIPREIRVSQMPQKKQSNPYDSNEGNIEMGFEVKV